MATYPNNRGKWRDLSTRPDRINDAEDTGSDAPIAVKDDFVTKNRPKLKFNFTVAFEFRGDLKNKLKRLETTNELADEQVNFAIKQVTRPNPTINYQDVNFYNYRTKVATSIDQGTVQLTFYDDTGNVAHDIYEHYIKAISPIANLSKQEADSLYEGQSGLFNNDTTTNIYSPAKHSTSSIGPLPSDSVMGPESGLIKSISLRHWFYSRTVQRDNRYDINTKSPYIQYTEYQFLNPKIVNITLDETDMSQNEVNLVTLNFVYDSVFINSPLRELDTPIAESGTKVEANTKTFKLNDLRSKALNIERLYRRFSRINTIPDLPVFSTLDKIIGKGNISKIEGSRPKVDEFFDLLNT